MSTVILSSYFTKKIHPNSVDDQHVVGRMDNNHIQKDYFPYIEKWYNSIKDNDLNAVLFYDGLSDDFVKNYETDKIKFIEVGDFIYSNNDYRFFCFRNFLEENKFDFVFHTDASDVVVVKNPSTLIAKNPEHSYFCCKDTLLLGQFPYLQAHENYGWEDYINCMLNQNNWELINMGVVGGRFDDMLKFYTKFCETRIKMGDPDFNSDMWILQYLLRFVFKDKKFLMGEPVCSEFKKYQNDRKDVYFIHK
ncbi:MAG: hypothetical protein HWN81_02030 [Candidatus Lokiarchaeota archaeon]|nr:hypothetical protein [Candidatus Lokiarchaeota archaeon]